MFLIDLMVQNNYSKIQSSLLSKELVGGKNTCVAKKTALNTLVKVVVKFPALELTFSQVGTKLNIESN